MNFSTLMPLLTPILSSIILAANMQSKIKRMKRNQHGQKTILFYSNLISNKTQPFLKSGFLNFPKIPLTFFNSC